MFRTLIALSVLLCEAAFDRTDEQSNQDKFFADARNSLNQGKRTWVLLAAGSDEWENYRHQVAF
ncbi:hypothetical protein AB6A40_011061 [Gnathostoma spinigerum]|uniref:Uncharacterized protein n=1 Tax=Gnathostoma spinigerum TaxID=75299 RepID=A0ABD6F3V7_9BILA